MAAVTQLGLTATPTRRRTVTAKRQKPVNRNVPQLTTLALTATPGRLRTVTPKSPGVAGPSGGAGILGPARVPSREELLRRRALERERDDEQVLLLAVVAWWEMYS